MTVKLALLENLRRLQDFIIYHRSLSIRALILLQSDLSTYDSPQSLPLSSKITAGVLNMLVQELVAAMEQLT
jgi:hypothetical protein